MNNQNQHIVSNIRWDLLFDQKNEATQLQNKLSAWSKIQLLKHLETVFSAVCPTNETWKIDTLQLDLGAINYADVNGFLEHNFERILTEELRSLTEEASGNKELVVLNHVTSRLQLFEDYLELGYMPWHQTGTVAINNLFLELLETHKTDLITRLKNSAKTVEVRKRIAWQFSEKNIQLLVSELEPNNHAQIIEFAGELSTIQEKRPVVQSNAVSFKKEVWFWILNHLLSERGTLYNRLYFMESTIKQMAQHHNLSYNELFDQIEEAITFLAQSSIVKPSFLKTFQLLVSQRSKTNVKHVKTTVQHDLADLKQTFLSPKFDKQKTNDSNFNERLANLAVNYTDLVIDTLIALNLTPEKWMNRVNNLQPETRTVLFKKLARANSHLIDQLIKVAMVLMGKQTATIKNRLEAKAIHYLLNHQNKNANIKQILIYLLDKEQIKKRLALPQIVQAARGTSLPISQQQLVVLTVAQLIFDNTTSTKRSTESLQTFYALFAGKLVGNAVHTLWNNTLKGQFNYKVWHQPQQLVNELKTIVNEPYFEAFLCHTFNVAQLQKVVTFVAPQKANRIVDFLLYKIGRNELKSIHLNKLSQAGFVASSLHFFIQHRNSSAENYLNYLFTSEAHFSALTAEKKRMLIYELVEDKTIAGLLNETTLLKRLANEKKQNIDEILKSWNKNLINQQSTKPEELAQHIRPLIKTIIETKTEHQKAKIAEYIVKDAPLLMRQLRETIQKWNLTTKLSQAADFEHFFWTYLTNWSEHKGCYGQLERLLTQKLKTFHQTIQNSVHIQQKYERKIHKTVEYQLIKWHAYLEQETPTKNDRKKACALFKRVLHKGTITQKAQLFKQTIKKSWLLHLNEHTPLLKFTYAYFNAPTSQARAIRGTLHILITLLKNKGTLNQQTEIELWETIQKIVKSPNRAEKILEETIATALQRTALQSNVRAADIQQAIEQAGNIDKAIIQRFFGTIHPFFNHCDTKADSNPAMLKQTDEKEPKAFNFLHYIQSIMQTQTTQETAFHSSETGKFLASFLQTDPFQFYTQFQSSNWSERVYDMLFDQLPFAAWVQAIKTTQPQVAETVDAIHQIYRVIQQNRLTGNTNHTLNQLIFTLMMKAWLANDQRPLQATNFWKELTWKAYIQHQLSVDSLYAELSEIKLQLPTIYQRTLTQLIPTQQNKLNRAEGATKFAEKQPAKRISKPYFVDKAGEKISVTNAGLVLVTGYVKLLFERLGLLSEDQFKTKECQLKAVHYLQYVVNGLTENEEHHLVLNKLLCGLSINEPVAAGIEITETEKTLIKGLIQAIINYWPAIGKCTINGFRGNWIIREGIMQETEERWNLNVAKQSYDLLINKSPFSFSIIKYKWMDKPIHVNWAY